MLSSFLHFSYAQVVKWIVHHMFPSSPALALLSPTCKQHFTSGWVTPNEKGNNLLLAGQGVKRLANICYIRTPKSFAPAPLTPKSYNWQHVNLQECSSRIPCLCCPVLLPRQQCRSHPKMKPQRKSPMKTSPPFTSSPHTVGVTIYQRCSIL